MARPPRQSIQVATTDRILAAGEREFARVGYAAARLEDVAAAAGIRRPSLLYHFADKDALYQAVVARAFARIRDVLAAALAAPGAPAARLVASAGATADLFHAAPDLARLLLREVLDGRGPGHRMLASQAAPLLEEVERRLPRGQTRLPPRLLRAAILQVTAGALLRAVDPVLAAALWGGKDQTRALARALFFEEAP